LEKEDLLSESDEKEVDKSQRLNIDDSDLSLSDGKLHEDISEKYITDQTQIDLSNTIFNGGGEESDPMLPLSDDERRISNLFSLESVVQNGSNFDMLYKVIILGNSGVGKSSVMGRWTEREFNISVSTTIHVELSAKSFRIEDKICKVQFWDTGGQERFNAITRQYYRGSHGALIVYDVTQRDSYIAVSRWLEEVREVNSSTVFLMVGNKCDLNHLREVEVSEALKYSKEAGIAFLETSAFTGNNCIKAMQLILQDIHVQQTKLLSSNNKLSYPSISHTVRVESPGEEDENEKQTSVKEDCAC